MNNKSVEKSNIYQKTKKMHKTTVGTGIISAQTGITLIALIVTIIIMLILTVVSIKMSADRGLFNKAETAVEQTYIETIKEQLTQALVAAYDYETNKITKEILTEQINKIYPSTTITGEDNDENNFFTVTIKGKTFKINKTTGEIEYIGLENNTQTSTLPEGWDGTKVTVYKDENEEQAPIPNGYVASKATGETTIESGLVIYEGIDDVTDDNVEEAKTARNQFVWIPITNIEDMAVLQTGSTTNYRGILYNWSSDSTGNTQYPWNSDIKEPENLIGTIKFPSGTTVNGTTFNTDTTYVYDSQEMFTLYGGGTYSNTMYQTEFNEMVASVEKYGGFYVGRYETGGYNTETTVIRAGEIGNSINSVTWFVMYNKTKELSTNSATAHMIWGSQYDQVLKFGECANETTETKDLSTIESGAVETDCYKNIYDLCGNVCDRTMETKGSGFRIYRGGNYRLNLSSNIRNVGPLNFISSILGSRATLYVTP